MNQLSTKIIIMLTLFCSLVFPLLGVCYYQLSPSNNDDVIFSQWLKGYNAKGTAEFIDNDGTMITAFHVGGSTKTMCVMINDQCLPARLIAGNQGTDVAVIKINYKSLYFSKISPVPGEVGTSFLKFGYPLNLTSEGKPDIKIGHILKTNVSCTIMGGKLCRFIGLDYTTWVSRPGDSGGSNISYNGGIIGITSAGNEEHSLMASWISITDLLNKNEIKYYTSTFWSQPSDFIIKDTSRTIKVVWLKIDHE